MLKDFLVCMQLVCVVVQGSDIVLGPNIAKEFRLGQIDLHFVGLDNTPFDYFIKIVINCSILYSNLIWLGWLA